MYSRGKEKQNQTQEATQKQAQEHTRGAAQEARQGSTRGSTRGKTREHEARQGSTRGNTRSKTRENKGKQKKQPIASHLEINNGSGWRNTLDRFATRQKYEIRHTVAKYEMHSEDVSLRLFSGETYQENVA